MRAYINLKSNFLIWKFCIFLSFWRQTVQLIEWRKTDLEIAHYTTLCPVSIWCILSDWEVEVISWCSEFLLEISDLCMLDDFSQNFLAIKDWIHHWMKSEIVAKSLDVRVSCTWFHGRLIFFKKLKISTTKFIINWNDWALPLTIFWDL